MINSRSLADLHPRVFSLATAFLTAAMKQDIDLIVTSTFRDNESQAILYAQGRTTPGRIVTNAKPGHSFHNWRVAFDVVPVAHGKCIWDGPIWDTIGALGQSCGLEWGGAWTTFPDRPHFQQTFNMTIQDFLDGKTIPMEDA